jgi:Carbohydrate/starch-binding module (family 21)
MGQPPVRLKYAESDTFSPGGGIGPVTNTTITAKVQNLAFAKDVAIHYAQPDGTWAERPLPFQRWFGTYDTFSRNDGTFVTTEFVVRYTVNGQTFWDNNGGTNYRVDELRPNTVGGNVVLNKAIARRGLQAGGGFTVVTSWVEGEIYVKNLSFNKRVGIRLSANDWASFRDTDASFAGLVTVAEGLSQVEVWTFKTPEFNLDVSTPVFRFAIFYNNLDSGEWFWDNNFGQDYTLSKADAATAE